MSLFLPAGSVLLADIGGTSSRFAVTGADGRPQAIVAMANDGVPGPEEAIARYLERTGAKPRAGVLAVACPVEGERFTLTNRAWHFRLDALSQRFGLAPLRAINDFAAVAWGVPRLRTDELHAIGPLSAPASGVRIVCGPGTGMGVAALLPDDAARADRWRIAASEGGHVSFGAAEADEEPVFARLRASLGHVAAESILSGPGLVHLHAALHREAAPLTSEALIAGAKAGDAAATATVSLFVRLLGRFAGDLALTFKALGAVYLTGGVARALDGLIDARTFRAAFEAHPPYEALLDRVPTLLITADEPGLIGAAAYAERMMAEGA